MITSENGSNYFLFAGGGGKEVQFTLQMKKKS